MKFKDRYSRWLAYERYCAREVVEALRSVPVPAGGSRRISGVLKTAEVIGELIRLAEGMREADRCGEYLGLCEEELAFYDAFDTNNSAVKVLGEPILRWIAQDLVPAARRMFR